MKALTSLVLVLGLAIGMVATPAQAEIISLHFTGFNFLYDGTDIFDATSKLGGNGLTTQADQLAAIDFFQGDTLVGTLPVGGDKVFADLLIQNVSGISKNGGFVVSGGNGDAFGMDLLSETDGMLLSLTIDEVTVSYSGFQFYIAAGGQAAIASQNLPFGLVIDEYDEVLMIVSSSQLSGVTHDGTNLTGFAAFGTGDVNGTLVPEPSTFALLGSLAIGLLVVLRRRRAG